MHPQQGLTLACTGHFAILDGTWGVGVRRLPPSRFLTKRLRAWRKRPADCSQRVLAIGDAALTLGQYFTQLSEFIFFSAKLRFFTFTSPYLGQLLTVALAVKP